MSPEQAEAIDKFESRPPGGWRIPPVAEALGYVGAAVAVAALVTYFTQFWWEVSTLARGVLLGAITLVFFVGGWVLRGHSDPAVARLSSVLWALSVASGWGLLWVLLPAPSYGESDPRALEAGLGSFVYAAALWTRSRATLQLIALFVMTISAALGAVVAGHEETPRYAIAFVLWILGVLMLLLSWRGLARPVSAGYAAGAVAALYAPGFVSEQRVALIWGLATAVALMVASIPLRRTVLLGLGALGVFYSGVRAILWYIPGSRGVTLALLIAGLVLVAGAVLAVRPTPGTSDRSREPTAF